MINKIVKEGKYKGFNYMVKHYDWTDNTKKGNADDSYSLDFQRTTDWFCGYVEIPQDHEFYELDYIDIYRDYEEIDVHGGLSFVGRFEPNGAWYIGFDCHHLYDNSMIEDEYYAERQCKYLIEQLVELDLNKEI